MRWMRRNFADPRVVRHLLADEGEVVVDEVRKHWVVYITPMLIALGGVILLVLMFFTPEQVAWIVAIASLGVLGYGAWQALEAHMDRFVITNMRVFRVHGVLTKKVATTPIMRILDVTIDKPFIGRILGYGHFVFESAAQEQGLRNINFVGKPDQRDLTIQRLLQRSGLRATASDGSESEADEEDGSDEPVVRTVATAGRLRADHPKLPGPPSARRGPR